MDWLRSENLKEEKVGTASEFTVALQGDIYWPLTPRTGRVVASRKEDSSAADVPRLCCRT